MMNMRSIITSSNRHGRITSKNGDSTKWFAIDIPLLSNQPKIIIHSRDGLQHLPRLISRYCYTHTQYVRVILVSGESLDVYDRISLTNISPNSDALAMFRYTAGNTKVDKVLLTPDSPPADSDLISTKLSYANNLMSLAYYDYLVRTLPDLTVINPKLSKLTILFTIRPKTLSGMIQLANHPQCCYYYKLSRDPNGKLTNIWLHAVNLPSLDEIRGDYLRLTMLPHDKMELEFIGNKEDNTDICNYMKSAVGNRMTVAPGSNYRSMSFAPLVPIALHEALDSI